MHGNAKQFNEPGSFPTKTHSLKDERFSFDLSIPTNLHSHAVLISAF
jgi:hypothetical protein